jgi:hypothetical protein
MRLRISSQIKVAAGRVSSGKVSRASYHNRNVPLCSKFLRQSFHEWAGHSIGQSVWARAYYQRQRERGTEHHAAVRALAFKWIRIVFRCWQDRVAYDETRYLTVLAKRGSLLTSGSARRELSWAATSTRARSATVLL